ncbi:MAG TPA: SHOCT domain-containing protein [Solirubrobacterales bacterium]|nr:SHOCT domain-containing protein [Solirubrobacterales bacterium]
MLLAEFGLGEALLTTLSFFMFVIWIWIMVAILSDLFRDHEISGWAKAAWVAFLVFLPFLGALVYLIARGDGMRERGLRDQAEARKHMDEYIRQTAGSSPVDELAKLNDLKQQGAISPDEFDRLKTKLVG